MWRAGFIWDDDKYVTNNLLLTAPDGLKRIWFSFDSPSQYFPLVYTTFRMERAFWGLNPAGYHWVNLLLHAVNALLLWRLLRRLNVPGAWLAAAIFALHPVQVESVAWITELKNVLSLFFSLLSLLAWVEFADERFAQKWRFYLLALMFFALALFSKTTACTLPVALLLILWLKEKPIERFRLAQILPFLALGAGMGLMAMWWERYHQGTQGRFFSLDPLERVLIASRAVWFYAGKLIWPANLTFSYPHWTINSADLSAYGWLVAGAGLCAAICIVRRFVGRSVEVAALFYIVTLSPLLGIIVLYTFRYTYVADHYQYIASIGPLALAAAGITKGLDFFGKGTPFLKPMLLGLLVLVLATLTWRQSRMYTDLETLWGTTIVRNPHSSMACNNLGAVLIGKGKVDEAITCFQKALQIEPENAEAHDNLGLALLQKGQVDPAIIQFQKSLEINPDNAIAHGNLGSALLQNGRLDEAITHFQRVAQIDPKSGAGVHSYISGLLLQNGRTHETIEHYEMALKLQPGDVSVLDHLAWILATCPDTSVRNGERAVALAQRADKFSGGKNPSFLGTLAAAYAEAGRFSEAVATARRALELATAQNNAAEVNTLQMEIELYQTGSSFRDTSLTNALHSSKRP